MIKKLLVTSLAMSMAFSSPTQVVADEQVYDMGAVTSSYMGRDYPKSTSTHYGKFYARNIAQAFAALVGAVGFTSASNIIGSLSNIVPQYYYYSYTQTNWRTNGITYVDVTISLYSDPGYSRRLASTSFSRTYTNDGLDSIEDVVR